MNLTNHYPYISIRTELKSEIKEIHSNIQGNILLKEIGLPPEKPKRPIKPYEPYKFKNNGDTNTFWICIIGYFVLVTLIIIWHGSIGTGLMIAAFGTIFNGYSFFNSDIYKGYQLEQKRKNEYENELGKYNRDKAEYPRKMDTYNRGYEKYKTELANYNSKIDGLKYSNSFKILEKSELNKAFNNLYRSNFQETFSPNFNTLPIPEGKSERLFYEFLLKYFGKEQVFVNQQFEYYFPDFVLIHPNRIPIDIELDEPYALRTKEPIHFINSDSKERIDAKRDKFFTSKSWAVIRFSEYQVKNFPDECCKEIFKLCEFLNIPTENKFKLIEDLDREKMWEYEDSLRMALTNFREN